MDSKREKGDVTWLSRDQLQTEKELKHASQPSSP